MFSMIAVALLYGGDVAWVRLRIARHQDPRSTMEVRTLLAVPLKDGRMSYAPGSTETRTCVNALFPQLGVVPCWYLERHTRQVVQY